MELPGWGACQCARRVMHSDSTGRVPDRSLAFGTLPSQTGLVCPFFRLVMIWIFNNKTVIMSRALPWVLWAVLVNHQPWGAHGNTPLPQFETSWAETWMAWGLHLQLGVWSESISCQEDCLSCGLGTDRVGGPSIESEAPIHPVKLRRCSVLGGFLLNLGEIPNIGN